MKFKDLVNPGIDTIHPYEPGRSLDEVIQEFNLSKVVKLASNENSLGASKKALEIVQSAQELHYYPDGSGESLKRVIAEHENIARDQIILGNGSNEVLELVASAFLSPETEAIFSEHAFVVYKLASKVRGCKFHEVPAKDFGHDLDSFKNYINDSTRVIFIANPNNPTGTYNTHAQVHNLLSTIPDHVLVVLDLAYFEYVEAEDYVKPYELLTEFNNLLLTRSFSKAYGLPALRIGFGVGHPELIELLNRIRQPFNVNTIAQKAAIAAIEDQAHIKQSIENNSMQKQYLQSELTRLGLTSLESEGNFIAVKVPIPGRDMFNKLMKEGVIVRPIDLYGMPDFIRVTIGTPAENKFFIEILEKVLN